MWNSNRAAGPPLVLKLLVSVAALFVSIIALVEIAALVSPLAKSGSEQIAESFGAVGSFVALASLIGGSALIAWRLRLREARREYRRTGIITIEKTKPTPTWAKVALWIQGAGIVFFIAIMIATGGR